MVSGPIQFPLHNSPDSFSPFGALQMNISANSSYVYLLFLFSFFFPAPDCFDGSVATGSTLFVDSTFHIGRLCRLALIKLVADVRDS